MKTKNLDEVTQENFWESYNAFEKKALKNSWRQLKTQCLLSLAISIAKRIFFSMVVIPGTLLFYLFLLEAYSFGITDAMNAVFYENPRMTERDAQILLYVYYSSVIIFFTISWIFPWKSPAKRRAERLCDQWWVLNGSKLPGLHENNKSSS